MNYIKKYKIIGNIFKFLPDFVTVRSTSKVTTEVYSLRVFNNTYRTALDKLLNYYVHTIQKGG